MVELIIFAGVFFNSARDYIFFHYDGNANDVFGKEREREKKDYCCVWKVMDVLTDLHTEMAASWDQVMAIPSANQRH